MADEVMFEEDFPCPCGNSVLRVQVLEHDTWVSGQHTRASLRCPDCSKKYRSMFLPDDVLVLRSDADTIEKKQHELYERRRTIGKKAVDRYYPQFSEFVNSLKFKTAMYDALGRPSSLEKFRKEARFGGLEESIKTALSNHPLNALKQIKIEDEEIEDECKAVAREESELKQFTKGVEKHKIPGLDELHRPKH